MSRPMKTLTLPIDTGEEITPVEYTFVEVESTFTTSGKAADSKATGDRFDAVEADVTALQAEVPDLTETVMSAFVVDEAEGAIATFPDGADNVPVKALTVDIEPVQSGSGDPSPSNVRPITGHIQAVVTRTGKNLFDEANATLYTRYFGTEDNKDYWRVDSSSRSAAFICKPSTAYTVSCNNSDITIFRVAWIDVNPDSVGSSQSVRLYDAVRETSSGSITITTGATAVAIVVQINASIMTAKTAKLQIEVGSTASDYSSYHGETYTIDLDGTRYGGTLDVSSGVLTVDKTFYSFNGTEQWEDYSSFNGFFTRKLTNMKIGTRQDGLSNMLKVSTTSAVVQTNSMWLGVNSSLFYVIGVYDTMGSTVEEFKTYLSEHNLELVYPLSTPLTVQLDPETVTTLLGQNNIFCDAGSVAVSYRCDTKLYIDKLLNA